MNGDENIANVLNEQQVLMLRLLKNPLPEADFKQIRKLAVQLLAKQLDETLEGWEKENQINEESYKQLSHTHFRSATNAS